MKLVASLAVTAAALGFAAPASAQFQKPEDAVKYRQSVMTVMANHFGRVGAMVNGRVPYDARVAAENAEVVNVMSHLPWPGFAFAGANTQSKAAKPEIWSEPAKFKEHGDKLMAETTKLVAAAKTNNLDNLKSAFQSTANTCKGCHDNFRNQL
jgi:cytochrome c556